MTQISGNEDSCTPLQKGTRNSPEFRGKIPGFPGFFAHKEKPGKSPEKPRVSGPSWLSRNSWKSQESLERKFPRFPGFSLCAKCAELLTRMIAGTPWLFLDSGVSWKAWKNQKKISTLSGLFLMCKKSPELLTGIISGTSWFFLDSGVSWKAWKSLEKPRENLPHGTLGSSLIAGLPRKPGKAKRRFSTLHSSAPP